MSHRQSCENKERFQQGAEYQQHTLLLADTGCCCCSAGRFAGSADVQLPASLALGYGPREVDPSRGIATVGAVPWVVNYNVLLGTADMAAARRVAAFLGTQHHEFTFTVEEGIDAVYDLIYHIESFEQARRAGAQACGCLPVCCSNKCMPHLGRSLPQDGLEQDACLL